MRSRLRLLLCLICFLALPGWAGERPRARELGIAPGVLPPGPWNAITDVAGVRVGQVTLITGTEVRTGVTAIVPYEGNLFRKKVPAAIHVANGFGKLIGSTQLEELGELETPILLTNTLSVWEAANALVEYTLAQPGNEDVRSVNPLVGETNDGFLNDIRGRHLGREHFLDAIARARSGPLEEGNVGAGTGTVAFGLKGGIGTSSRKLPSKLGGQTIGVLVQTNFGGILTIDGVPVGKELGQYYLREELSGPQGGSCMIVVATDAPIDARQLRRLARRATVGLARTGWSAQHGSGDYVIAFTVADKSAALLPDEALSRLFQAVAEATEEAVYNSLLRATTIRGREGHEVQAIDIERLREILKKYGR